MKVGLKVIVYVVAAAALLVGVLAYTLSGEEDEHDDEGLVAGDTAKVVLAASVLGIVAAVSLRYLAKAPPGGV